MKQVLSQIQKDLIELRSMLPLNDRRSKRIIKRINWAITAIQRADAYRSMAEAGFP